MLIKLYHPSLLLTHLQLKLALLSWSCWDVWMKENRWQPEWPSSDFLTTCSLLVSLLYYQCLATVKVTSLRKHNLWTNHSLIVPELRRPVKQICHTTTSPACRAYNNSGSSKQHPLHTMYTTFKTTKVHHNLTFMINTGNPKTTIQRKYVLLPTNQSRTDHM
jgi:hypothetical protein